MKKRTVSIDRNEFPSFLKGVLKTAYNLCGTIKYKQGIGRIAVVISAKQEKRAVYRNKFKRRVRVIFLKEQQQYDAIFYPAKKALTMEYQELKKLFHELIKKM